MRLNRLMFLSFLGVLLLACATPEPIDLAAAALTSPDSAAKGTKAPFATVAAPRAPLHAARLPARESVRSRLDAPLAALLTRDGQPRRDAAAIARGYRLPFRADAVLTTLTLKDADLPGVDGEHLDLGGYRVAIDRRFEGLVQAWIPVADLARVGNLGGVARVAAALPPRRQVVSEGLAITRANLLHAAGTKGAGITIGVIDVSFGNYAARLGTELPATVETHSFAAGGFLGGAADDVHGTAVAEILHDLAPDANLVLVNIDTLVAWQQAVAWLQARPVDIISASLGSEVWEPLDGRGALAQMASGSTQAGVPYFASAGNYGDVHYYGTFTPAAGAEDLHDFGDPDLGGGLLFGDDTGCYVLPVGFPLDVSLIWDDWGSDLANPGTKQDYDLYLLRWTDSSAAGECSDTDPGGTACWVLAGGSVYDQSTNGGAPIEYASTTVTVEGCHAVMVSKFSASKNHTLQLFTHGIPMATAFRHPEHSVVTPCVGEHTVCIGATTLFDTIAEYSSNGPAIPNELTGAMLPKPDVAAPTGVATASYAPEAFGGTSASAPHAAGVYALLLQLSGKKDAVALAALKQSAYDLGDPGRDDVFGWGRVEAVACTTMSCVDGLECTTDTCDPLTGCSRVASGVGCWMGGACVAHGAKNPANACEVCNQASPAAWSKANDGLSCDDGKYCTVTDACLAGVCAAGPARDCSGVADACHAGTCDEALDTCLPIAVDDGIACPDDGNACTADSCKAGACEHKAVANGLPCTDDGNTCTADYCLTGACQHTALANGLPCEDGLYCTIGDACAGGACTAGGARDCSASSDLCNTGTCDEATDACKGNPLPNGTACTNDANECTNDVCTGGACTHAPVSSGAPCASDGLGCTLDLCLDGACGHTVVMGCLLGGACVAAGGLNPANSCEACDPAAPLAWSKRADGQSCEDGQFCTVSDACASGVCLAGGARDCSSASDACNAGVCDEAGDGCAKSPAHQGEACASDADACTTDTCDAGVCGHVLIVSDCGTRSCGASPSGCHDCGTCPTGFGCDQAGTCSDLCKDVTCPECTACQGGACVPANEGAACSGDGNACTANLCAAGLCTHPNVSDGAPCDDADACTRADTCVAGACQGADPVACSAADACHVDGACEPATGLCSTPPAADGAPCPDDGLACTADACAAGACRHDVTEGCLIDGACVAEGTSPDDTTCRVCDPAHPLEWTAVTDATPCDDGLFCSVDDTCSAGACQAGPARDCSGVADSCNGSVCIEDDDACRPVPLANGLACETDGFACSTDTCTDGVCAHTVTVGCLVDGACVSVGSFNPQNACQYCDAADRRAWTSVLDGTACEDGAWCNLGDTCLGGACLGGAARDCSFQADGCNAGACDDDVNACVKLALPDLVTACDDADACTPASHCLEGACVGEDRLVCPDQGLCAGVGACDGLTGQCVYVSTATGTPCDDGLFCTVADACADGACEPGGARDCSGAATECLSAACDEGGDACVTAPFPTGTPCGADASCVDGVAFSPDACDGQGACAKPEGVPCAPYAACADASACATTCATDDDCADEAVCADEACRANTPPTAEAGAEQVVDAGAAVTLDGRASSDAEGDALAYLWSQVEGPAVTLDDPTSDTPVFTAPTVAAATALTFRLVVSDPWIDGTPDETVVTVNVGSNEPPVAHAGPDSAVLGNHDLLLDGTGSSDPDGDPLTYAWSIESGPGGAFDDPTLARPTFTAPAVQAAEAVVLKLIVNDGQVNSAPDTVTLTVSPLVDQPDTVDEAADGTPGVDAAPDAPATDTPVADDEGPVRDGGGSGCAASGASAPSVWLLLASLLGLAGLARRRAF